MGTATSWMGSTEEAGVTARLRYRAPYDWALVIGHLEARAIEGVEEVAGDVYRRTVGVGERLGHVGVRHAPAEGSLNVTVYLPPEWLALALARVERVFDATTDVAPIAAHLSREPHLAPLLALRPGLRVPGGFDGFELAVRAILGQQVTIGAARRLAGKLVALSGRALPPSAARPAALSHAFPTPEDLAAADLGALGMPGTRRTALKALAEAALRDPDLFRSEGSLEEKVARLRAIRGIGEWTAQYIALRALRDKDAFPASDIGLLRGAALAGGERPTPAELLLRAEAWRPFRAYAAQHLWAADAELAARVSSQKPSSRRPR
jgi:AraC family transcriptional regulator, regulatory protein of adaptative response / DNA-3-methyladenine glycosylase II